jgi:hypothetical protein
LVTPAPYRQVTAAMLALVFLALHRVVSAYTFKKQKANDIETEIIIVVLAELLKGSFCYATYTYKEWRKRRALFAEERLDEQALLEVSVSSDVEEEKAAERSSKRRSTMLILPASLLIVQNILFVMSAKGLQPAIFQVCSNGLCCRPTLLTYKFLTGCMAI